MSVRDVHGMVAPCIETVKDRVRILKTYNAFAPLPSINTKSFASLVATPVGVAGNVPAVIVNGLLPLAVATSDCALPDETQYSRTLSSMGNVAAIS